MTAKPEGPVQEQHGSDICQCGDYRSQHVEGGCGCDRCGCKQFVFAHVASAPDRMTWNRYRSPEAIAAAQAESRRVVPATPAPSQPAGARELDEYVGATLFRQQRDWLIAECARVGVTVNVAIGAPLESAYRLVNDAAQQTAAKDAELDKLRTWVNCGGVPTGKQCSSPIESGHDIYGPFIGDGAGNFICEFHAWKAVERERDSLREALQGLIHNDKCDCLKCIRIRRELDAALKAGKETKK